MRVKFLQNLIDTMRGKRSSKFSRFIKRLKICLDKFTRRLFKKKINLVFVVHRPQVWDALKSVFEACLKDDKFSVKILAIPNKKQLPDLYFSHEIYESEGAEEFFKNYPCEVINGYEGKTWFDLKKLKPDYVFFQTPYNICRPPQYHSNVVSKYAKLLYVSYFYNLYKGLVSTSTHPLDFFNDLSMTFLADNDEKTSLEFDLKDLKNKPKLFITGYPKFDDIVRFANAKSDNFNYKEREGKMRLIWTPRWNTEEQNCHFFDYKDKLLDYVKMHEDVDFIFRAHPQTFTNFHSTGEFTQEEADIYKAKFNEIKNAKIDTQKEYLSTFYDSDVLLADVSSVISDYFLTGKPIIYCHKTNHFNDTWQKIAKDGFYWVRNWQELQNTLEMLRKKNDPLKEKRLQIIKDNFYFPKQAGISIKDAIKQDFYKISKI